MPTDDLHHRSARPPMVIAGRTPLIVAAAASLVTVLAFFAMPLISFGPFELTGAEVAGAPDTLGSDAAALGLLWIVPLAAVAAAAVAATRLLATARTGAGRATLVAVLDGKCPASGELATSDIPRSGALSSRTAALPRVSRAGTI
ncbi:hypothetical protein ACVGOW_21440 [Pseudonocardia saturnea]